MRTLSFLRTIGAGAVGMVYLAELGTGQNFRRQVAVKVIQNDQPQNDQFLSRIRDEARLLGLLQHDAILKVLDMVDVEGRDAVVMEYVDGVDLDSVLRAGHTVPPRALAEIGAVVAAALHRAHTATHPSDGRPLHVIHRDVKPANVMIGESGGVKLLDFGVARAQFEARESYTGQLVLGTLNYMAPEYIVTGEVSPAADIYGLGLALWECAAAETFGQPKVRKDAHEARLHERLGQIRGRHPQLADAIGRMLAWEPSERPDAREAEQILGEVADRAGGASLRAWARDTVPAVVRTRPEVEDIAGLVGRTVPVATVDRSASVVRGDETIDLSKQSVDVSDRARAAVVPPSPTSSPPPPPKGRTSAQVGVAPPRKAVVASAPQRRAPAAGPGEPPFVRLVVQGVLIGGALGVIMVLFVAVLLWRGGLFA